MIKAQLLRKLENMIDNAERTRMWGTLEIQFNDGTPALIRKSETEKIASRTGEPRAERYEDTYNR